MAKFVELFGEELLHKGSKVATKDALSEKQVGIYFSHGPSCDFTTQLAKLYEDVLITKDFEVIFVSLDEAEDDFNKYFATMPWKAVPYDAKERKLALVQKFDVQQSPKLVILDAKGDIITAGGVAAVKADPLGEEFPWIPNSWTQLLGSSFVRQDGRLLDRSAVEGKILGLYFSAHWCVPCRGFTPVLMEWYKRVIVNLPKFEIVYVSADHSEEQFKEYFETMPWIAIPYSRVYQRELISSRFGVSGIPCLVIVDTDGVEITKKGREIPTTDPDGLKFPWSTKRVVDLVDDAEDVMVCQSLVVLMENAGATTQSAARNAMESAAEEYVAIAKTKGQNPKLKFFFGGQPCEGTNWVRSQVLQKPVLLKHEHPLTEITEGRTCDGCKKESEGTFFHCEECEFDYCPSCNELAAENPTYPVTCLIVDNYMDSYYAGETTDVTSAASLQEFLRRYDAGELPRTDIERDEGDVSDYGGSDNNEEEEDEEEEGEEEKEANDDAE